MIASTTAWISAIGSVATAAGVLLAYLAIRSAQRASLADHYFDLAAHLQSDRSMQARRTLLDHWDATGERVSVNSPPAVVAAAGEVASMFSTAGRVVALGYVHPSAFLDEYAPLIVRMHDLLVPYLEERRTQREDPTYHASFSGLADTASWWLSSSRVSSARWLVDHRWWFGGARALRGGARRP